jgi:hypothetical protein
MSRANFTTAIIIGAGISLSAIAATRMTTHAPLPAASAGNRDHEDPACAMEQYFTLRQPLDQVQDTVAFHPLVLFRCILW